MNHSGNKIKSALITFFLCVVGLQIAVALIQPYLGIVGKTLAITVGLLLASAAAVGTALLIKWLLNRFGDGGGTFNG